jgi:hypothetical protein
MNESYDMKIYDMDESFHLKINVSHEWKLWHETEIDKLADKRSKWMKIHNMSQVDEIIKSHPWIITKNPN